ncbi:succinylglutamate desuccinylase [Haloarchaeobius sp. DFWS5]|uniref:succinylglutamate desuccinylase n=1 Tax=Haloarchaeobius sp. DFWS5 TaxID=3446114 RepID=UPI003EBF4992
MRVEHVGTGDPVLAVVTTVHGDEVCGSKALERILAADPTVRRPYLAVVANEAAHELGVRFVDEDLNRAFPGDRDADTHEGRLAAELLAELDGLPVIDLHSTLSTPRPFALYQQLTPTTRRLLAATGLSDAVDISHVPGGLVGCVDGVAVECGLKGSEAAVDAAEDLIWNVLAAFGVVDRRHADGDPTVFEVTETVAGTGYEFLGENFTAVERGTPFARRGDDELVAETDFYPVLMSTDGYDDMVGFGATRLGKLSSLGANEPDADDE